MYKTIVFRIKDKHDLLQFDNDINDAYQKNDKVCFMFYTSQVKFYDFELLSGILPILEKYRTHTKEKLLYSIVYVDSTWKVIILKSFLKILKPEKPVLFKTLNVENL